MKSFVFIALLSLITVGCSENTFENGNDVVVLKEEIQSDAVMEKEVYNEDTIKKVNLDSKENTDSTNDIINDRSYINDNLGFGLDFPDEWQGYYKIVDIEGGISINFFGKSLVGQGNLHYNGMGLPMFHILNEDAINVGIWDGIKKVGMANEITYYYATTTDAKLSAIALIDEDVLQNYIETYGTEFYGTEQIPIINQDWQKAKSMYEDIPNIINSFEAVEIEDKR